MVNLVEFERGGEAPMHAHAEEQLVLVLEGEVRMDIGRRGSRAAVRARRGDPVVGAARRGRGERTSVDRRGVRPSESRPPRAPRRRGTGPRHLGRLNAMRAAVFEGVDAPLSIEDVVAGDPGPRDVVVRIAGERGVPLGPLGDRRHDPDAQARDPRSRRCRRRRVGRGRGHARRGRATESSRRSSRRAVCAGVASKTVRISARRRRRSRGSAAVPAPTAPRSSR